MEKLYNLGGPWPPWPPWFLRLCSCEYKAIIDLILLLAVYWVDWVPLFISPYFNARFNVNEADLRRLSKHDVLNDKF